MLHDIISTVSKQLRYSHVGKLCVLVGQPGLTVIYSKNQLRSENANTTMPSITSTIPVARFKVFADALFAKTGRRVSTVSSGIEALQA